MAVNRAPGLVARLLLVAAALCAPQVAVAAEQRPPAVDASVREAWGERERRICTVCEQDKATPEHSEMHRGRLVPVCGDCYAHYQEERERFLAELQPRSALFHDEVVERRAVSWQVFGLGAWVTFGLLCGALAGGIAGQRGHRSWRWVLSGLAVNLVAVILALRLPSHERAIADVGLKSPATRPPAPCPGCAAANHPSARRCSGCGRELNPTAPSEVEAADTA